MPRLSNALAVPRRAGACCGERLLVQRDDVAGPRLRDLPTPGPARYRPSPNGFELTGAGLAPSCLNDNRASGVRCSDVLGVSMAIAVQPDAGRSLAG